MPPANPNKRKKAAPAVMLLFTLHLLSVWYLPLVSEPTHKDPSLEIRSPLLTPHTPGTRFRPALPNALALDLQSPKGKLRLCRLLPFL